MGTNQIVVVGLVAAGVFLLFRAQPQKNYTIPSGILKTPWDEAAEVLNKPDWSSATVVVKPPGYWDNACQIFGGC